MENITNITCNITENAENIRNYEEFRKISNLLLFCYGRDEEAYGFVKRKRGKMIVANSWKKSVRENRGSGTTSPKSSGLLMLLLEILKGVLRQIWRDF